MADNYTKLELTGLTKDQVAKAQLIDQPESKVSLGLNRSKVSISALYIDPNVGTLTISLGGPAALEEAQRIKGFIDTYIGKTSIQGTLTKETSKVMTSSDRLAVKPVLFDIRAKMSMKPQVQERVLYTLKQSIELCSKYFVGVIQ